MMHKKVDLEHQVNQFQSKYDIKLPYGKDCFDVISFYLSDDESYDNRFQHTFPFPINFIKLPEFNIETIITCYLIEKNGILRSQLIPDNYIVYQSHKGYNVFL